MSPFVGADGHDDRGLIEKDHGERALADLGGDLIELSLHGLAVLAG
ncbi:MAG: hypothetical protein QF629_01695 [Alphaproteobacteria bacterium]|jgi:hypothetical protein|nr:hypothetical protein [Alphaproteobacteria bacterium]MDP6239391.1 hypothetical protein [Alphaproteobacteria bacterium]MDP7233658.1 hypothetical protein [Alphaproteobacteria bacterium]|tara:strand:+ start:1811 stop:1948 length:138 start_codon:yes stop_codon:yes gene_type:complete